MPKLLVRMPEREVAEDYLIVADEGYNTLGVATDIWELFRVLEFHGGCDIRDVDFESEAFCRARGWMRGVNAIISIGLDKIHSMMPKKAEED